MVFFMIKQKEQLTSVMNSNLRGGKGDILRTVIFSAEELLEKGTMCMVLTIPDGSSIGDHAHGPDAELYYVLSGTLRITDGGITRDLVAGEAVFTGNGSSHSAENVSGEEAMLLAFVIK
jgi:quercetin dioxygenase-like cupin family protein